MICAVVVWRSNDGDFLPLKATEKRRSWQRANSDQ
jgi:hypothetical protein